MSGPRKVSTAVKRRRKSQLSKEESKKLANATWRMKITACFEILGTLAIKEGKKPTRKNTLETCTNYIEKLEQNLNEVYGEFCPTIMKVLVDSMLKHL